MFKRLMAAALTAGLLLGAPSVSLAQSAGDNQYQDPLPSSGSGGSGSSGHSGSSGGGASKAVPNAATPAPRAATTPRASAAPSNELPRTGGEPMMVALVGSALLLAGGGLRLAAPRPD